MGSGAREHCIAESLSKSSELYAYCKNFNPGIRKLAKEFVLGDELEAKKIAEYAREKKVDFAVIGPEAPLEQGVVDCLEENEIPCIGPVKKAAKLETDKLFCRELLRDNKIDCNPDFSVFKNSEEVENYLLHQERAVIKPLGLTGGKGVKVMDEVSKQGAINYAKALIQKDGIVLVEEVLTGEEFSLQAFVFDGKLIGMPLAQDHKRAFEGDKGPNCYSEDTEILTDDGWKKFNELQTNTKVATFQPRFRRIRFEKPKERYWKKYCGNMVSLKHREIDLLVTPNHRMFIQPRKGKRNHLIIEARNLKGEFFIPQTGVWVGTTKKFIRIPKSRNHYGHKKPSIKIAFDVWAKFLGLFLSEGCVVDGRVYVCQSKNSKHLAAMKKILEKMPFKITYEENRFRINSRQLADFLKPFGHAHEKYVPDYLKNSKPKFIDSFLTAYCRGDGDIHRGQMRFRSSSKKMIGDLQELFIKTGKVGIITVDKRTELNSKIHNKTYSIRPMYALEVKKRNRTSIRKNNIRLKDYNGFVGCVTVSTGLVIVRRNGRVAICGNTGGMGSYSDSNHLLPFITESEKDAALEFMKRTVQALQKIGINYRGVLYGQFMLTKNGPKLIEYNARFGDPECMNVLPLLKEDFTEVCGKMIDGSLSNLSFERKATVVKYVVPKGYPVEAKGNEKITVDERAFDGVSTRMYYASVNENNGEIFLTKSRGVAVLGIADSIYEAEEKAEKGVKAIKGNVFYRPDIGKRELVEKRIAHMKSLLTIH